ncbi:MAG TPA: SURF1 family protein [Hydrogenophaga sp.]
MVLGLLGLALMAGFLALGSWQLQRRAWKLDLIDRVEQGLRAVPSALPPPAQWPGLDWAQLSYRPVVLQGRWRSGGLVLSKAVTALGSGFWVMTPLELDSGARVWVNRGFVPDDQRARWLEARKTPHESGVVSLVGLMRANEPGGGFLRANDPANERWYSRDVVAMAQARGVAKASPFFVDAGLPGSQAASGGWPRQGLTVVRFSNSHLVYALTWFSLALMVAGAMGYVARYGRARR